MARSTEAPAAAPETTQADPTSPWPTDAAGRPIDRWGLPLNGPARRAALAEKGIEDPALAQEEAPAPAAAPDPVPQQEPSA